MVRLRHEGLPCQSHGAIGQTQEQVRRRAYQKWLARGCQRDTELQDWLEAEAELTRQPDRPAASRRMLQAIIDNTSAIIYVKDLRGRYLLVNRTYETIFHVVRSELSGKTDQDLFPRQVADAIRRNDLRVLRSGRPAEFEEVVPHADGPHTYISLKFLMRDLAGRPFAVCGISTDISERKRIAQRLEAEHAVSRALAESASLEEAAPRLLRAVCETLGWPVGVVWCVDDSGQALRAVRLWHAPEAAVPAFARATGWLTLPRGTCLPGRVWQARQPCWLPDVTRDDDFLRGVAAADDGLFSALAVPIRVGDAVLGVLEFLGRRVEKPGAELLDMLEALANQFGQFVERKRAESGLRERTAELRVARRIQQGFFPQNPPAVPGLALAAASLPAQETGGDYIDFVPMADGRLGVAVGDVSGHGIGPALLMAVTRAYLRAFASAHADPREVLARLNRALVEDTAPEHFVTLVLCTFDPATRALVHSNAGHLPAILIGRDGAVRRTLESSTVPLGLEPSLELAADSLTLEPGDLLLLMTDGVIETFGADGRQYGLARAVDVVRRHRGLAPKQILWELFEDVLTFGLDHPQMDDRSAIVCKLADGGGLGR